MAGVLAQQTSLEGYIHGSLSTEGIAGASPSMKTLTKLAAKQQQGALQQEQSLPAAAQQEPASLASLAAAGTAGWLQDVPEDPGMRPKIRIPQHMNKPDLIHNVHDIEGAQSRPCRTSQHPRGTNPINPDYHLPSGYAGMQTAVTAEADVDLLLPVPAPF